MIHGKKRIAACVLMAVWVSSVAGCSSGDGARTSESASEGTSRAAEDARVEGPGFDSPEAAAMAFLDGLKSQNMDAMLGAFAVESFVDSCDYTAWLERVKAHTANDHVASCPFPDDDGIGRATNVAARQAKVANSVVTMMASVVSPHLQGDGVTQPISDAAEAEAFDEQTRSDFADYVFSGLTDAKPVEPEALAPNYSSDAFQSAQAQRLLPYGLTAEDYRDVPVTFTVDGEAWAFCPSAARYHGKWYLLEPQGDVSGLLGVDNGRVVFVLPDN